MDHTLDLARSGVEAERLRWLLFARRFVIRAGLIAGGLMFLGAALTMAHILALAALEPHVGAT